MEQVSTIADDRIAALESELAEAQKMRDFYRHEGALDFEWGQAEKKEKEQRDLWAKAWKAAAKVLSYWVDVFKNQNLRIGAELTELRAEVNRLVKGNERLREALELVKQRTGNMVSDADSTLRYHIGTLDEINTALEDK